MEKFILPKIEIINLDIDEIICTSGPTEEGYEPSQKTVDVGEGFW